MTSLTKKEVIMTSSLWQKTNYTNRDIDYLKNVTITEYDISSAGMNILYDLGMISTDRYAVLSSMRKHDRVVAIGMLLKDAEMNKALSYGFEQARKIFIEQNGLEDGSILSIKRDAFYLINKDTGINGEISSHIKFKKRKTYSSFIQIDRKEHYLEFSRETGSSLEVKGYKEIVRQVHKDHLFKFLQDILVKDLLGTSKKELFIELLRFKDEFVSRQLPQGYYRELVEGTYPVIGYVNVYGSPALDTSVIPLEQIDYRVNLNFVLGVINLILST